MVDKVSVEEMEEAEMDEAVRLQQQPRREPTRQIREQMTPLLPPALVVEDADNRRQRMEAD